MSKRESPAYKRVLLKLSGEALMGSKSFGIDPSVLKNVAAELHDVHKEGVELALVIGRGTSSGA
jgi:uridylate kinase